jgi:gliding motility-associated lipoprotein GldD
MKKIINLFLFISLFVVLYGCNNDYTPKPRGYFRIDLPEKKYQPVPEGLPYHFEYPVYAAIERRNSNLPDERFWINVVYPKFNAKIYISYKSVNRNVEKYLEDSRSFVYKHTIKADAISETPYIDVQKKVYGILYEIKGDAASNIQFFTTDSTRHFVRGALYFNEVPNKDSLAPVIEFLKADIQHIMETFEWNGNGTAH